MEVELALEDELILEVVMRLFVDVETTGGAEVETSTVVSEVGTATEVGISAMVVGVAASEDAIDEVLGRQRLVAAPRLEDASRTTERKVAENFMVLDLQRRDWKGLKSEGSLERRSSSEGETEAPEGNVGEEETEEGRPGRATAGSR